MLYEMLDVERMKHDLREDIVQVVPYFIVKTVACT